MAFDPSIAQGFYELMDPLSSVAFRGTTDQKMYQHMRVALRGEQKSAMSVIVKHSQGRRLMDFIWVSLEPLIHDRVLDALMRSGVTGWSTYPVEVVDKNGTGIHGYHGFSVVGRCESMFVNAEHSELVYVEYPKGIGAKYRGLHITRESWDGSDVFTCADKRTGYIVATDKARESLLEAKISNVGFQPLSEVQADAGDQPFIPYNSEKGLVQ